MPIARIVWISNKKPKRYLSKKIVQSAHKYYKKRQIHYTENLADFYTIRLLLEECVRNVSTLHVNTSDTVFQACTIADKYQYSFYDSLIIASAIEAECQILYSEDMQHNQFIEGKLKIINPFL